MGELTNQKLAMLAGCFLNYQKKDLQKGSFSEAIEGMGGDLFLFFLCFNFFVRVFFHRCETGVSDPSI